jgi:isopenicillin-N N-acyltransferase-like protein
MIRASRSFSNNIMISDARGIAVDLETTPREVYWLGAENGLLVHANHFVSPAGRARVHDTGLAVTADSLYRDVRVWSHLAARRGRITEGVMIAALADDFASPALVNRPPTTGPGGDDVSTVATIVMNVTERTMTVVPTPYAQSEGRTYRLAA